MPALSPALVSRIRHAKMRTLSFGCGSFKIVYTDEDRRKSIKSRRKKKDYRMFITRTLCHYGLTNGEISGYLSIAPYTVQRYIRELRESGKLSSSRKIVSKQERNKIKKQIAIKEPWNGKV